MKKIILTLCGFAVATLAIAQFALVRSDNFSFVEAAFEWNSTTHDFGKIPVNVPVSHEFTFVNSGSAPLIISSAQASCGCTVTSYSKDPIPPGGQGFVKATYNASKVGQFTKTVTVNSNTIDGVAILSIKAEVVE